MVSNIFFRFSDDEDNSCMERFKEKLDNILYEKTQQIENKRNIFVKRQMEIEDMDEGVLKKRLMYSQEVILGANTNQEERELHEAYQFCIREYECRHRETDITSLSLSNPDVSLTDKPDKPSKKKKDRRRSAEVVSMYRGKKSTYEKVAEASSAEEVYREAGEVILA